MYILSMICLGAPFMQRDSKAWVSFFSYLLAELVKMFNKLKLGTILKLSVRNKSSKYIVI